MSRERRSSEGLRQNGNDHCGLAKSAAARVPERRRHLWSALDCYKDGLNAAEGPRDRSLCWKNSAVAHKELCLMEWSEGHKVRAWDHLHASLSAFSEAWRNASDWSGRAAAGDAGSWEWSSRFTQQFPANLLAMYSLTLSSETDQTLVDNLGRVCDVIGRYGFTNSEYLEVVGNVFIDYANRLLHLSVSLDKKLQYGLAYSYIAKMHFPIKEAERLLGRNPSTFDCMERELETLRQDQRIQETVFHSRVELERGKAFLLNLGERGQLNDEALLAMDHLRAALSLISEDVIDIVLEAEVCSSIGNVYLTVFKAESLAEKHFKRCIQLVLCYLIGEREVGCRSETWYAAAERGLRTIQERQAKLRDDERLKELKADGTLDDIKASYKRGIDHFLAHIYAKYPPPPVAAGQPVKKAPAASKPLRQRLMAALMHYHPDKVGGGDRRTYYICEEITKYLNVSSC